MEQERKTKPGWLIGAIVFWLSGFVWIVAVSIDVIGGKTAVFSWDFLLGIGIHAVCAVLAVVFFKKAVPPKPVAEEAVQEGGV